MKRFIAIIILVIIMTASIIIIFTNNKSVNASDGDIYDIILFWGQSQMVGFPDLDRDMPDGFYDDIEQFSKDTNIDIDILENTESTSITYTPIESETAYIYKYLSNEFEEIDEDTYIFGDGLDYNDIRNGQTIGGLTYNPSTGKLEKYVPGVSPYVSIQVTPAVNMIPEFCRTYYEKTGHKVIAVTGAVGGASIEEFLPHNDEKHETNVGDYLYEGMIENFKGAVKLASEEGYNIGGKYWVCYQGESDIFEDIPESNDENLNYWSHFLRVKNNLKSNIKTTKGAIVEIAWSTGFPTNGYSQNVEKMHRAQEHLINYHDDIVLASDYEYIHYVPEEEIYNSNSYTTSVYVDRYRNKLPYNEAFNRAIQISCYQYNNVHYHSAALSQIGRESATNLAKAVAYKQKITFNSNYTNNGTVSESSINIKYGNQIGTLPQLTREGYIFEGWYTQAEGGQKIDSTQVVKQDATYYAHWKIIDNIKYVVNHWQQNIGCNADLHDNINYTKFESEENNGTYNDVIEPNTKSYEGFTSPSKQSENIKADGTTEINYYYTRNNYNVVLTKDDGIKEVIGSNSYEYGEEVSISAVLNNDYLWKNWTGTDTVDEMELTFSMPARNVELQANSIKQEKVIVEYMDINTNEKILEDIIISGIEGESYTTEKKEIPGYKFISATDNANGIITQNGNNVIYKYAKNASIEIRYIDRNTNQDILSSEIVEGYVGKEYDVKPKSITGYEYVETLENEKGTMTDDKIIVNVMYAKEYGLTVKYVDINTNEEISKAVNYQIANESKYDVTKDKKDIEGYTYIKNTENTVGTMKGNALDVIYYYAYNTKVRVQYIDMNYNKELVQEKTINGYQGKEYETDKINIDGYKLIEVKEEKGTMTKEEKVVKYGYKKIIKVNVQYINKENNNIIETKTIESLEGEKYNLNSMISEIVGYNYISTDSELNGIYGKDDVIIKLYYAEKDNNNGSNPSANGSQGNSNNGSNPNVNGGQAKGNNGNKILPNAGNNATIIYIIAMLTIVIGINWSLYKNFRK